MFDRTWRTIVYTLVITTLLAAGVAGCSRAAGGALPPAATPPPSSAVETASPTASVVDKLAPELFWTRLFGGDPAAINYPTLAAMASDSDLVILGAFKAVRPGPNSVAGPGLTNYMLTVDVAVDRVLRGDLATAGSTVPVAVFLGVGSSDANPYLDETALRAASLPQERGVFFLQNVVKYYSRFDPGASTRYDPSVYQVASLQGLVRDNAGVSWVPAGAPGDWPATLSGAPFSTALETISSAATAIK